MEPLPTTPLTSTPTAGNLAPLRAGRFIVESSRHSRSRSDLASEERIDESAIGHDVYSTAGSGIPGSTGSPAPDKDSPVNRVGRFAVASKDADILDVIRRNVQANNAKRNSPIQDTLTSLTVQVQALVDRNNYLENENVRLTRELEALRTGIVMDTPTTLRGARAPSVKSENS